MIWNNENETIYLRPICPPNSFEVARIAEEYRRINLRFTDINLNSNPRLIDRLRSSLGSILRSFEDFQGINAQVIITVGHYRNFSLEEQTVRDTLIDIEENPNLFSKAEIAKKDDDDTKVELIDLFEHKAHDFGTLRLESRGTLSHYRIAEEMWTVYSPAEGCNNRQRDINGYLRE